MQKSIISFSIYLQMRPELLHNFTNDYNQNDT